MTYSARNLIIALALAVAAALLVGLYVSDYKRTVQHSQQHVTVYVAAKDIPAGTSGADAWAKGYVKTSQVLRSSVVPGAISSPKQLAPLVAAQEVFAGEQIALSRFSTVAEHGIRAQLRGIARAIQISGSADQTLAGTLQAGDHVDVVTEMKYKLIDFRATHTVQNQDDLDAGRIVLRNVLVLRTTGWTDAAKLNTPSSSTTGNWPVVLKLTDKQAEKLYFVLNDAHWALLLRPVVKAADSPESVETVGTILGDGLTPSQKNQLVYGTR
jgi:Flp pilus assembly protein CpaB